MASEMNPVYAALDELHKEMRAVEGERARLFTVQVFRNKVVLCRRGERGSGECAILPAVKPTDLIAWLKAYKAGYLHGASAAGPQLG